MAESRERIDDLHAGAKRVFKAPLGVVRRKFAKLGLTLCIGKPEGEQRGRVLDRRQVVRYSSIDICQITKLTTDGKVMDVFYRKRCPDF